MATRQRVAEYRFHAHDVAALGDMFPEVADWYVVAVSKVGHGYPYSKPGDDVLRVKHWCGEFHVHIRPPRRVKESTNA